MIMITIKTFISGLHSLMLLPWEMLGWQVEKLEIYQLLKDEIIKMWGVEKVVIVLVIIGALGVVSKNFEKHVKKFEIGACVEIMQKIAVLGTARLSRKILSLCSACKTLERRIGDLCQLVVDCSLTF